MKKILLTGSRGFFGSRFIAGYDSDYNILKTTSETLDIRNKSRVFEITEDFRPDYIIHAGALAITDYCNLHPEVCRAVNVDGTGNIAEAAERYGSRLVFLSTEQVFNGNKAPGPYKESDTPYPDTVYGKNKLEAEGLITATCSNYLILRLTWLFGIPSRVGPVSENILWGTIRNILVGRPFRVPANEYRGLTEVDELIGHFRKIIDLPEGIYHTGSENNSSRYEIVCHILSQLGLEERIKELVLKDEEKYSEHPRDIRLDTGSMRSQGIRFEESKTAIERCIRENHLSVC